MRLNSVVNAHTERLITQHCAEVSCHYVGLCINNAVRFEHLYAFVHQSLHHALFEAKQCPAAKHNHTQLTHAEHACVNLLEDGEHPLQQGNCMSTCPAQSNPHV